jgi:hypothetical protein
MRRLAGRGGSRRGADLHNDGRRGAAHGDFLLGAVVGQQGEQKIGVAESGPGDFAAPLHALGECVSVLSNELAVDFRQ